MEEANYLTISLVLAHAVISISLFLFVYSAVQALKRVQQGILHLMVRTAHTDEERERLGFAMIDDTDEETEQVISAYEKALGVRKPIGIRREDGGVLRFMNKTPPPETLRKYADRIVYEGETNV